MTDTAEQNNQNVLFQLNYDRSTDQDENDICNNNTSSSLLQTPPKSSEHPLYKINTQSRSMIRQISIDQCPTSSNFDQFNPFIQQKIGTQEGGSGSLCYDRQSDVPKDVDEEEEDEEREKNDDKYENNFTRKNRNDEENHQKFSDLDTSPLSANTDLLYSPQTSSRVPPGTPFDEINNHKAFIAGFNGQIGIGHRRNDSYIRDDDDDDDDESLFDTSNSAFLTTSDTFGLPFPNNFSLTSPNTQKDDGENRMESDTSATESEHKDSLTSLFPLQKPINRPRQPSFPMRLTASLLIASKNQEPTAETLQD